jgi:flagellar biosynthesis anti-sigma factor FlgM
MKIPGKDFALKNNIIQEKISKNQAVDKATVGKGASGSSSAGQNSTSEQILLSSKAKVIQQVKEVVLNSSNIRTEKVNRIKKEIAEGSFNIDRDMLAEKILKAIITESAFLK